MKSQIAIKLSHVSKKYTLHHEKPTLVENVIGRQKKEEFWALKDINLEINKGDRVGIIGPNVSGKTTLLEIIAKITTPTEGEIVTNGKLVSLIELEAGFHPELTGEENIYLNGLLVGMSKEETNKKLDKIISFADIGQFIDAPLYTYSEGMKLRLGFSIVVHTNPDIVLLDENMAVGDTSFKRKSLKKIQDFVKNKKTLVVVSHLMDFVANTCHRVIWLEDGSVKEEGNSRELINKYLNKNYTQFSASSKRKPF